MLSYPVVCYLSVSDLSSTNHSPSQTPREKGNKHNTKTSANRTVSRTNHREGGGGLKAILQLANFTLGPDATLNAEIHKNSVHIKAPSSVNASKRKLKNQINHNDEQRRVLVANSIVCQSK